MIFKLWTKIFLFSRKFLKYASIAVTTVRTMVFFAEEDKLRQCCNRRAFSGVTFQSAGLGNRRHSSTLLRKALILEAVYC